MPEVPYTPFGLTAEQADKFHVLRDVLGNAARQSLIGWLLPALRDSNHHSWVNASLCRDVQLHTDVPLGIGPENYYGVDGMLKHLQAMSDLELLKVLDYVLSRSRPSTNAHPAETILSAARSRWSVGLRENRVGLVDRVPEGVRIAAEGVFELGTAGRVLARAWSHIHGLEKSPSSAYADAVRAVEIIAIERVQPNHAEATLGSVIGQMKTNGDWALPLREHKEAPAPQMLLMMLRTLWFGHRDRHGKVDYSDVTPDEARAAVSLAVSLVDWFDSKAISRRDGEADATSLEQAT